MKRLPDAAWPKWPGHPCHPQYKDCRVDFRINRLFRHTCDLDGTPTWLLAEGVNDDMSHTGLFIPYMRVEATAYHYEGMLFGEFDPATKTRQQWGTIILDFPC